MNILSKIVAIKKQEITQKKKVRCLDEIKSSENLNRKTHSLSQKIKEGEISIIAEHKRKSPSKKEINFKGYVTAPASGVYPGVLLLHQNYGMDANIRAYAEILAANNYTVFIPDLFWRDLPGCELNSNNDADINKSLDLGKNMYLSGDNNEAARKKSILGALTLYLDFILMFQFLLAFLGNRE